MARVSVILPVYNGEKFIMASVESILRQTFKDFTLYVVDDGSTDNSVKILSGLNDNRLMVIENGQNKGLIYTLNKGLQLASSSEFIARMDADDISHPRRFETQLELLRSRPDIGVVGTRVNIFGEGATAPKHKVPEMEEKILPAFICRNPFVHPTVIIRTDVLVKAGLEYDAEFPKYEDYKLWLDLFNTCTFYNIPEYLLNYRRHENNITNTYNYNIEEDFKIFARLLTVYAEKLGFVFTQSELEHLSVITSTYRWKLKKLVLDEMYENVLSVVRKHKDPRVNKSYLASLLWERVFVYLAKCGRFKDFTKLTARVNVSVNYIQIARIKKYLF